MNLSSKGVICLGEALTKHIRATVKETQPLHEADAILREFATVRRARALGMIKLTVLWFTGMKY